ncbi:MAG: hypothetical protein ACRC0C_00520 [Gibbsiella quercinecans]|uniref:hypothetical protein n=1 Tax=Gibbsiella quercinecans TaxID=929813 RepID=UPI003F340D01
MRELTAVEMEAVSGGSLTTFILDYIRQLTGSSASNNSSEWVRPEDIPEATPVDGTIFGMALVGVISFIGLGLII